MYLGVILIVVAVFCVIAGILSGGVFTIVLVPLAVIAVLAAVSTLGGARAAGVEGTLERHPGTPPRGPERHEPSVGEEGMNPDEYIEARRRSQ